MAEEHCLDRLKKEYSQFIDKYNLPIFSDLNKIFDIEEVDAETEFLLRKIRRIVSDRSAGYLRFIEIILNPSNAPLFFFKLIKKLGEEDKKRLNEIYEVLGSLEVEIIKLDLGYNEEKEAEFIKRLYNLFKGEVSKELFSVIEKMSNGIGKEKKENNISYFG